MKDNTAILIGDRYFEYKLYDQKLSETLICVKLKQ